MTEFVRGTTLTPQQVYRPHFVYSAWDASGTCLHPVDPVLGGRVVAGVPVSAEQSAEIALLIELTDAVAAALADRPQACGHSSDPMCCPYENFPSLAAFFDPEEDPAAMCGEDQGYGICGLPRGHSGDLHAVPIGGGGSPVDNPDVWFVFGDVKKATYRVLSLKDSPEFDPADYPRTSPGSTEATS